MKLIKESMFKNIFKMSSEKKDYINSTSYFKDFKWYNVSLDKLMKDNNLFDKNDVGSYHQATWGDDPNEYVYVSNEDRNRSDVIYAKLDGNRVVLQNGRHRVRALYNENQYDAIELPVYVGK